MISGEVLPFYDFLGEGAAACWRKALVWHGLWILEVLPNGKYFPQGSPRIARKRIDDWHCPPVHLEWLSRGSFSGRVQARGSFPVTHCKTGRKAGDNSGRFLKFAENRNQGLTTTSLRIRGVKAVEPRLRCDNSATGQR